MVGEDGAEDLRGVAGPEGGVGEGIEGGFAEGDRMSVVGRCEQVGEVGRRLARRSPFCLDSAC